MFSWICKICGRDNPPSASHCLSCGARFDAEPGAAQPVSAMPSGEMPGAQKPGAQEHGAEKLDADVAESLRADFAESPQKPLTASGARPLNRPAPTASRSGLPTWALMILFFFAIVGLGTAIYYGYLYFSNQKQATSTGLDPAANKARTKLSNPLQKYVEVVGIRLVQDSKRRPEARFIVVNHSPNALDDLSATVTLWASTSRSEEDSTGTFTFKLPTLAAYGSRDMTAPLNTKLKFYELPDWQNATPEVQITSP